MKSSKFIPVMPEEQFSDQYKKTRPSKYAAGVKAVTVSMNHIHQQSGLLRGTQALLKLNQKSGFDCPSCAWPDPDEHRSFAEFCENGAKAIASETTKRIAGSDFFRNHSIETIAKNSDYWHEQQGRLTEPMYLAKGSQHYQAISWEKAFSLCAEHLKAMDCPDQAIFYTSGRTSNEAAFLYQLFARQLGTNNLPDCSNMCHESSGAALNQTIGIGKGTVSLEDFDLADTIFLIGQNPGTNHPRMLSSLQKAKRKGATIIAINPLPEAGLMGFAHPQEIQGMLNQETSLTDHYIPVKINGDLPFLQGLSKAIFENPDWELLVDHRFIKTHTDGFSQYRASSTARDWKQIEKESGISVEVIRKMAQIALHSKKSIFCWAMGLTQHHNAVPTIREVVNLALIGGHLGRPGAGLCPVRGHSNVQGDRTMGIWEKMPEAFLQSLEKEFSFSVPREIGYDTVDAIEAMHDGKCRVFIGLGGNFLSATPDTEYTAEAFRRCGLTVHISTKLNRSHVITGQEALILPCLGRSETDTVEEEAQFVSCENSMGVVQKSQGTLSPIANTLKSEITIVSGIAKSTLGNHPVNWASLCQNYDRIRNKIQSVIPGFENFNQRVRQLGGFYLPNSAKKLDFSGIGGKAHFTVNHHTPITLEKDQLLLMTLRSHDQFNTTIYGMNDRYRGIHGERRVIFMNSLDMDRRGISEQQPVDIHSHFQGKTRTAYSFLAVSYPIPKGCTAAYFPEANVLVPLQSKAAVSHTPTSKSIVITISPHLTNKI